MWLMVSSISTKFMMMTKASLNMAMHILFMWTAKQIKVKAAAGVGNEIVNVVSDDDLEGDDLEDNADGNNVSCVFCFFFLLLFFGKMYYFL
jgi:hypothetical protein